MFSLIWTDGWVHNRNAGDLRRHRARYDVTVMYSVNHVSYTAQKWVTLGWGMRVRLGGWCWKNEIKNCRNWLSNPHSWWLSWLHINAVLVGERIIETIKCKVIFNTRSGLLNLAVTLRNYEIQRIYLQSTYWKICILFTCVIETSWLYSATYRLWYCN